MAYLNERDLQRYLTDSQRQTLKRSGEQNNIDYVEEAIDTAESYIRDRLNYKYDMNVEFAKTAENRNRTLVNTCAMLAIRELLIPFDLYDDGRSDQFAEANAKLDMIESGTLLSDVLPPYDPEIARIRFGTNDDYDLKY